MATARAIARYRQVRVVELVMAGWTYDAIAREVGYRSKGSVSKAFWRALSAREEFSVRTYRALETSRLDALQFCLWDRAMAGDVSAALAILRIIDRRIRVLGLDQLSADQSSHHDRSAQSRLVDPAFWEDLKETYGGNFEAYLEAAQSADERSADQRAV